MVALIGTQGALHIAQQAVHFIVTQAPVGAHGTMAGEGAEQFVAVFGEQARAAISFQIAQHLTRQADVEAWMEREQPKQAIIFVERGHRRITVQYAKRVVGRRQYGGSSTHIPLKVNTGGVIPVIFASSILAFPATIGSMFEPGGWGQAVASQLAYGMPLYNVLYITGIVFFAYFYTAIIFNPDDVAENMRKYGGFIPGIRPGKRTAEYIDTILARITLAGAIYLAIIAIIPQFLLSGFQVAPIPFIGEWLDANLPRFITQGMGVLFYFGGTSLLIVVGVAMDTVQQVESQLIMRHYDGFMKKTRIRGRRA